jgi:ATP-dependent Clp protease adapter protein ClpS
MPGTFTPTVLPDLEKQTAGRDALEPGYLVVCWNDPVNFMGYVTHVFQPNPCSRKLIFQGI